MWKVYFGYALAWPTCMYSQGGGHGDSDVKAAFHRCQWVILGNCRCGRPAAPRGGRPCGWRRENGIPRVSVGDFRQLSTWPTYVSWGYACYVFRLFRSRSAAVEGDLPRFSILFAPDPPPQGVCTCHGFRPLRDWFPLTPLRLSVICNMQIDFLRQSYFADLRPFKVADYTVRKIVFR